MILLAILESALGTTFGLDEMEGFDRTGAFPILMTVPSGEMFNFSDGGSARGLQPAVYWLAKRFSQPGWGAHEDRMIDESSPEWKRAAGHWLPALVLLWRDVSPGSPAAPLDLPLHWTSRNENHISVHRESWDRPDAVFVGLKAGTPTASHGQMDIGSFVLDANGVRWAHDLGMESYFQVESRGMRLWDSHQDGDRWRVFRNNNHSHNTLGIDGHDVAAWREIDIASPPNEWDSPNVDTAMIAFTATAPETGTLDFTVVIRPQNRPVTSLPERAVAHPLKWSPGER